MMSIHGSWRRPFFTIWSGQAFSLLGSAVVQFALIWWLTSKTGSAMVLSIASLIAFAPQALLGPFVGPLIDRWDRKAIMISADLTIAAAGLVLAGLYLLGQPQVWFVYAALAVRSLGTAFHVPAMSAATPMIVPKEELIKASGYSQAVQSASSIVAPALGALVVVLWPMWAVMLLDVAGAVVACLALSLVPIPQPPPAAGDARGGGFFREARFGMQVLLRARGLGLLIAAAALFTILFVPVSSLCPLMVAGHFGGGAWHLSAVEAGYGGGMLLGSLILGFWGGSRKKARSISLAWVVMGAIMAVMGVLPKTGFVWFAGLSAALGLSAPLFSGPFTALLQTKMDPGVQGRVFSVVGSIMTLGTPLGLLIAGPVADRLGVSAWFLLSGLLTTAVGAACLLVPPVRQLDAGE